MKKKKKTMTGVVLPNFIEPPLTHTPMDRQVHGNIVMVKLGLTAISGRCYRSCMRFWWPGAGPPHATWFLQDLSWRQQGRGPWLACAVCEAK
jgi:hypothetical protein